MTVTEAVLARAPAPPPPQPVAAEAFLAECFPARRLDRVLFITPPDGEAELFRLSTARRRRYPNYPPYGQAVLAANLRRLGVETRILNLNHEVLRAACSAVGDDFDFDRTWQERASEAVEQFEPDLIGVTCMFTMTHASMKRVCEFLAPLGIPIAIGGVHVSNDVNRVLDDVPSARIAFTRECDLAIQKFVEAVRGSFAVEGLGQVILNDARHSARHRFEADVRPSREELNVIPAYDLIDVGNLTQYGVIGNFHGFKSKGARFATCLSNRGCRAQCTFCSVANFNGRAVRQRDVDNVLDELQLLHERYGIEHITWLDDDLLKDHARTLALFNGIVQRNLKLTWDATNGVIAASCTEEIVHAMAASGCIALNIGMESGNPGILRQIKKPGTVRNFIAAAEVLRKYEQIHARVFLMLGFPGETLACINDTINVARTMDLDWCGITVLQPLPNTPIYDAMVAQGLIDEVGSREVRFNSGGYGKQDQVDMGIRRSSQSFEEAFCSIDMEAIPTRLQLDDIWFFMNYHLNFHRLFGEERSVKIRQQMLNLSTLSDVISPEHGFALYFTCYLQHKLEGRIDPDTIARLERKLAESPYWADRFDAFGLSIDDLKTSNFRNKSIPRLLPGQVPADDRRFEDLVTSP
jgi:radical SAM superfamily enzyme YgiQ (UPF0313 family)